MFVPLVNTSIAASWLILAIINFFIGITSFIEFKFVSLARYGNDSQHPKHFLCSPCLCRTASAAAV